MKDVKGLTPGIDVLWKYSANGLNESSIPLPEERATTILSLPIKPRRHVGLPNQPSEPHSLPRLHGSFRFVSISPQVCQSHLSLCDLPSPHVVGWPEVWVTSQWCMLRSQPQRYIDTSLRGVPIWQSLARYTSKISNHIKITHDSLGTSKQERRTQ